MLAFNHFRRSLLTRRTLPITRQPLRFTPTACTTPSSSISIRRLLLGSRKWSADDILALSSWFLIANSLLLLLNTTTYTSFVVSLSKPLHHLLLDYIYAKYNVKISEIDGLTLRDVCVDTKVYSLTVDKVDLQLDLLKYFSSSIIKSVKVSGLNGTINLSNIEYGPEEEWRRKRKYPEDDINLEVHDCFLTIKDDKFRPYSVQIHHGHMRFRRQWLLFDILNAESLVGEVDGSLFSVIKRAGYSKLRVSSMNIDLVGLNWIRGYVDLDVKYVCDDSINAKSGEDADIQHLLTLKENSIPVLLDMKLHHIRASVPKETNLPNYLLKPIIAYFNAQPTSPRYRKTSTPPLRTVMNIPLDELDGAQTIYQANLDTLVSDAISKAVVDRVMKEYAEYQDRGKKGGPSLITRVGWHSLQQISKQVVSSFNVEPVLDKEDELLQDVYMEMVDSPFV